MKKMVSLVLVTLILFASFTFAEESKKGSLLIVGGALREDNAQVYEKFAELAGGITDAKVAIVPAASGSPYKYSQMFKNDMISSYAKTIKKLLKPSIAS